MNTQFRKRLSIINDAATKRVVKQFCAKYHLVYFGHVDAREDEHQLVRGVTVSTTHKDDHYSVGTYNGHDLVYVLRRSTLTFPGHESSAYKWLILQVDLKRSGMPHVFIDAKRHDETFYANLFVKVPHFQDVTNTLTQRDPQFAAKYTAIALPNQYERWGAVFIPQITGTITQHFNQFDFEIDDDHVYIYAIPNVVNINLLQEMLQAGVWLADSLDQLKIPG